MSRTHAIPPDQTRRWLEPGPVVLLSTAHNGERGIMTLGWHMMLGYDLVGTYIDPGNRSHALARGSRECVINLPTADLLDTVVRIGNCSSADEDKFERFGLTAVESSEVDAPGIGECHARFECRLHETRITADYPLFVWRVVAAHAAKRPKWPRTVHYRGAGQFMISGDERSRRALFKPEMLES
ncbi:flavin reductase family protein [Luteimonas sp. XNQY3]|nr:flavin reductase family protein [Luteimonas sp. XNQY3]MCD9007754.1 flavin reductase family protein [Luteimonas sp. XNQY3]